MSNDKDQIATMFVMLLFFGLIAIVIMAFAIGYEFYKLVLLIYDKIF